MKVTATVVRRVLVFAAIMAPFTLLRFSFFGVAELLIMIMLFYVIRLPVRRTTLQGFTLTRFWLFAISVMVVGAFVNHVLLPSPTSTASGLAFDFAAYTFILATCFIVERLHLHGSLDIPQLLREIFLGSSIVLGLLYFASLATPSVFGLPLRHYHLFVPLAENVHQVSMFLTPLPFLGLAVLAAEDRNRYRLLISGMIILGFVMALESGSFKAMLGLIVGCAIAVYSALIKICGRRYFLFANAGFILVVALAFERLDLLGMAVDVFREEDPAGARAYLYGEAIGVGFGSPVVGRGPGPHVFYGEKYWDVHQTYVTLFLQGGLLALGAFVVVTGKLVARLLYSPALLGTLACVLVYALGGDILRRLPIWFVILLLAHHPVDVVKRGRVAVRRRDQGVVRTTASQPGVI